MVYGRKMNTATVSTKFQVVIPREIRNSLNIQPGQKVRFIVYKDSVEMVPIVEMKNLWGVFRGIDTTIEREETDRV